MKACVTQLTPKTGELEYNLKKIESKVVEASENGSDMIVFPELMLTGYKCNDDFYNVAIDTESNRLDYLKELSIKNKIVIIFGAVEITLNEVLYNSAFVIDQGQVKSVRKNCLPGHAMLTISNGAFPDRKYFKSGENVKAIDTSIGRIGILICYDVFFPELSRYLTLDAIEYLVVISGSPKFEKNIFEPILLARSLENTVPILYSNLVGQELDDEYWGGSRIISSNDEKKLAAEVKTKIDYTNESLEYFTFNQQNMSRRYFPVLRDLKSGMYSNLKDKHDELC